jgi:hypothetical protein
MSALGQKRTFHGAIVMSVPPKWTSGVLLGTSWADGCIKPVNNVRLTFATPRLRNHLFACIAHIREMVFHAGFDTATPRLNICAILFDVRSASLADSPRLYQRKLAGQRKVLETSLDARRAALTCGMSRALSLYIGSAC